MFNIKSVEDERELTMLREFMLSQYQYYPDYNLWVDSKCIPRIQTGEYKNIIVVSDKRVIANAITRADGSNIEVKNFRIDPNYQNRDLGHFLLAQVSHLNPGKPLVLDVTVDNFRGVEFFLRNGFHIKRKAQLYRAGQDEYLMERLPTAQNQNPRN